MAILILAMKKSSEEKLMHKPVLSKISYVPPSQAELTSANSAPISQMKLVTTAPRSACLTLGLKQVQTGNEHFAAQSVVGFMINTRLMCRFFSFKLILLVPVLALVIRSI
jgi:hypothetical protein